MVGVVPASANGIDQHDSEMWMGDFHAFSGITYIPRGTTIFVSGNLYIWPRATLWVEGNLWVVGRIYIGGEVAVTGDTIITGRNAWQLSPCWQWVVRLFLGGWLWGLISWIDGLFFPKAPSDWPFY